MANYARAKSAFGAAGIRLLALLSSEWLCHSAADRTTAAGAFDADADADDRASGNHRSGAHVPVLR